MKYCKVHQGYEIPGTVFQLSMLAFVIPSKFQDSSCYLFLIHCQSHILNSVDDQVVF